MSNVLKIVGVVAFVFFLIIAFVACESTVVNEKQPLSVTTDNSFNVVASTSNSYDWAGELHNAGLDYAYEKLENEQFGALFDEVQTSALPAEDFRAHLIERAAHHACESVIGQGVNSDELFRVDSAMVVFDHNHPASMTCGPDSGSEPDRQERCNDNLLNYGLERGTLTEIQAHYLDEIYNAGGENASRLQVQTALADLDHVIAETLN